MVWCVCVCIAALLVLSPARETAGCSQESPDHLGWPEGSGADGMGEGCVPSLPHESLLHGCQTPCHKGTGHYTCVCVVLCM